MSASNLGEPQVPTALGIGYDSFASVIRTAVPVTFTASDPQTRSSCRIKICEGIQELNETLEISAAMSAGIPGVAKIEAKVDFVRSLKATSRTVSIVIHAQRFDLTQLEHTELAEPAPTTDAEALAFYHRYGDSYTSMIENGSEYIAIYSFYSETTEEVDSVKGTLSASGIVDGVEITAELSTKLTTAVKESYLETRFDQTLYGIGNLPLPPATDICQFALNFVSKIPDRPVVTGFGVSGYERLLANRDVFKTIIDNRTVLNDPDHGIARSLTRRHEILNQAYWLRDAAYKAYGYAGDTDLNSKITIVETDKSNLKNWLATTASDPTKLVAKPTIQSHNWGLPQLTFTQNRGGSWGYEYDGKADFLDKFSAIQPWAIRHIKIKGDKCVDKLEITYGFLEIGEWADPKHDVTIDRGGDGGSWSNMLSLEFGEYITSIAGSTNNHGEVAVTQLVITTNKGQTFTYPPAPWPSNNPKDHTSQFDQACRLLVAFTGQTGDFLNSLHATVIELKPAVWS